MGAPSVQRPGLQVVEVHKSFAMNSKDLDSQFKKQFHSIDFDVKIDFQIGMHSKVIVSNTSKSTLYIYQVNLPKLWNGVADSNNIPQCTSIDNNNNFAFNPSHGHLIILSSKEIGPSNFNASALIEYTPENENFVQISKIKEELENFERKNMFAKCVVFLLAEDRSLINPFNRQHPGDGNYQDCIMKLFLPKVTDEEYRERSRFYEKEKRNHFPEQPQQYYNYPPPPPFYNQNMGQPIPSLQNFVPPPQLYAQNFGQQIPNFQDFPAPPPQPKLPPSDYQNYQNFPVANNNVVSNAVDQPNYNYPPPPPPAPSNQQIVDNDIKNDAPKSDQAEVTFVKQNPINIDPEFVPDLPNQQNSPKTILKNAADSTDGYLSMLIKQYGTQKLILFTVAIILALILIIAAIVFIAK